MFYAERFPNPTRAPSPRQLPTDHVHAVPTREYQSDQSSRMLLRCFIGPAVPNKTSSRPTSRNVFAPEPPSNVSPLPERCSQSRVRFAAPNSGAPLTAALRSGPLLLRRAAPAGTLNGPLKIKPVSRPAGGLTGSLHIRTGFAVSVPPCGRQDNPWWP